MKREELNTRIMPEMVLSDGSIASLTAPTVQLPPQVSAQQRAMNRFAIHGNAAITGGAGNLALEGARALLEHGLSGLALLDINPAQAKIAINALRTDFPAAKIITIQIDVTDEISVVAAIAQVVAELGSIDILCCYAGVVDSSHALDMTAANWRRTLDINTTGVFLCAQEAAKHMISRGTGGAIAIIASIAGHRVLYPQPQVSYNVAKTALLHLARTLAAEWARYGIRVNTISPGYMQTILNEGDGLAKVRKVWTDRNPMGRMGEPCELTGPLILLCSKFGGAYMTGTDVVADGGTILF